MGRAMPDELPEDDEGQERIIDQILELQREYYFENKGKDSERRGRLREIIERNTQTPEVDLLEDL
jgi:hypothetical protein